MTYSEEVQSGAQASGVIASWRKGAFDVCAIWREKALGDTVPRRAETGIRQLCVRAEPRSGLHLPIGVAEEHEAALRALELMYAEEDHVHVPERTAGADPSTRRRGVPENHALRRAERFTRVRLYLSWCLCVSLRDGQRARARRRAGPEPFSYPRLARREKEGDCQLLQGCTLLIASGFERRKVAHKCSASSDVLPPPMPSLRRGAGGHGWR
eukprot:5112656-Pleurochrysis_carterae.AAC.1